MPALVGDPGAVGGILARSDLEHYALKRFRWEPLAFGPPLARRRRPGSVPSMPQVGCAPAGMPCTRHLKGRPETPEIRAPAGPYRGYLAGPSAAFPFGDRRRPAALAWRKAGHGVPTDQGHPKETRSTAGLVPEKARRRAWYAGHARSRVGCQRTISKGCPAKPAAAQARPWPALRWTQRARRGCHALQGRQALPRGAVPLWPALARRRRAKTRCPRRGAGCHARPWGHSPPTAGCSFFWGAGLARPA